MKIINKFIFALLAIAILSSCEDNISGLENNANSRDWPLTTTEFNGADPFFEESVAIIQRGAVQDPDDKNSYIFFVELKDFSGKLSLNEQYTIGKIVYSDNGKYQDEIAGDGIYTSIQSYRVLNKDDNPDVFDYTLINISDSFKYKDELESYISNEKSQKTTMGKIKVKFGCKVRTITCPETHWWNSCGLSVVPVLASNFTTVRLQLRLKLVPTLNYNQ